MADLDRALRDEEHGGQITCPAPSAVAAGESDITGSVALRCASRARAWDEMERDSERLGVIAHDLDEVYTDIADKFPGLEVQKMQSADQREKDFTPASVLENGAVNFSFKLTNGTTQSCIEFTQELDPDTGVYASFVSAKAEPENRQSTDTEGNNSQPAAPDDEEAKKASSKWSLSVDGRRLCFDNLSAGLSYRVVLKKGLPSKLGMKLASDIEQVFDVPDYPQQIRFAGGRFVLPQSGSGTIDVHATNLRSFDLELYREHRLRCVLHAHVGARHASPHQRRAQS